METEGAIQNSKSAYNSPLLIIPKKIGATGKNKLRIIIDFRFSSKKTIGDAYPLTNMLVCKLLA